MPPGALRTSPGRASCPRSEDTIERLAAQRQRLEAARERTERERREAQARLAAVAGGGAGVAAPVAGAADPDPDTPEKRLREELRLAEIRRAHDSLRSPLVALSLRAGGEPGAAAGDGGSREGSRGRAAPVAGIPPDQPDPAALADLVGLAPAAGVPEPVDAQPTPPNRPDDPPGWERIYEGQWLEAVLATRLRGDQPGPAVAIVSSPLWSRDRQRVLVPRGTRAIGRAEAVSNWGQARLAVGFHRLVFPDGTYLRLEFAGLDQSGASGLQDRVNRHYLSTLGAAGAVGVIAGLTLRGSQPFSGGVDGARAGAGIGMGRASERVLERYLNRLPTVTIRAGQRLRILFSSDALVPRPAFLSRAGRQP